MALIQLTLLYGLLMASGVHSLVPGLYCGVKNCYDGMDLAPNNNNNR